MISAQPIGANPGTFEAIFQQWFSALATLMKEFEECEGFDPFDNNETCAVSALLAGAARAGYAAVSDYGCSKSGSKGDFPGRVDLWFNYKNDSFAFEFKRWRNHHKPGDLTKTIDYAVGCAEEVYRSEAQHIFAGVIIPKEAAHRSGEWLAEAEPTDLIYRLSDDRFSWHVLLRKVRGR